MSTIITVENLGKKYTLSHQSGKKPYVALKDVLTTGVKNLAGRFYHGGGQFAGLITPAPYSDDFWALRDVSFEVKQGDRIGIIGRNGAGKSTLLKILSRITEPTTGSVRIKGRVASLLEVGTGFHPELTGRENIFLNGAILGMSRTEIKRKFDEIVDFADIEKFLDTPVKRYSSGMYVRLAFAVAAHLEPEILIVDEVLAVGDAQFQKKCLGKMEEVGNEGRTVLFVSHNMVAIQRLCLSVFLMADGNLAKHGDVEQVVNAYLDAGSESKFLWERSGDLTSKDASFLSVFIADEFGVPTSHVETGGCLRVCVEFVVEEPSPNIQLGVCLLDDYGNQIFGSLPQDSGFSVPSNRGRYRATVEFIEDLLLPRAYSIKSILWVPETGILDCVQSISFIATETACLGNSTPGGRAGLISLRCSWSMIEIS